MSHSKYAHLLRLGDQARARKAGQQSEMNAATKEAKSLIDNASVMCFLRQQALEKVAVDMQAMGYSCTAKAVDLLTMRHNNIAERVNQYIASGVVGCLMAKYQ